MKKPLLYAVLLPATCLIIFWYSLCTSVVSQPNGYVYYLRPNLSKKTLISELAQQGVLTHPWLFSLYIYPQKKAQLKTAEYVFPPGSTPRSIWRQVTTGTGVLYHTFTIIPGWSFNQLRQALAQAQSMQHLTASLTDLEIMERLGQPALSPEGEFFAESYYYTRDTQDLVILKRAFILMQKKLEEIWQMRSPGLPYHKAYDALIAASLIEKEAYLDTERPIIAGVLINRLNKGMLLQFDPTVIYGLGTRYDGKIHKKDLQENTLYNTYLHKGLPPTPIAVPGWSSLEAAVKPQQHGYYYFVAKGDGSHQFSETLVDHNVAVKQAANK